MIRVRGNKAYFSGKDAKLLAEGAKNVGMSPQNFFTGLLLEHVMREARKGTFKSSRRK